MTRLVEAVRALPGPAERRIAVRATRDAVRQLRGGHPWLYRDSVRSTSHDGAPGDLAVVFDERRRFVAIGLFDPEGPIAVRVLQHGEPTTIDVAWWEARVRHALSRRAALLGPDLVNTCDAHVATGSRDRVGVRLVNGESDGLPGLVVDRYADVVVLKIYTGAWTPWLATVAEVVVGSAGARGAVLRLARRVTAPPGLADGDVIAGDVPPGPVLFTENGLVMEADVRRGQKTGYFLDHRANRQRVRELSAGCDVLDVFAATGGFSVHAAAGGARSVHSVDASGPTLAVATRNFAHNERAIGPCRHTTEVGDAFDVLTRLGEQRRTYDVVVVDPPSFTPRQASVPAARRAYTRLTALALPLVRGGGQLVQASCSSRITADEFVEIVERTAGANGHHVTLLARTGHDIDHPVGFPEGEYLKAGFWRVDR